MHFLRRTECLAGEGLCHCDGWDKGPPREDPGPGGGGWAGSPGNSSDHTAASSPGGSVRRPQLSWAEAVADAGHTGTVTCFLAGAAEEAFPVMWTSHLPRKPG